jgi:signal transduction histidine kinase
MSGADVKIGSDRERAQAFLHEINTLFSEAIRDGGDPDILQRTLEAAVRSLSGKRGFLALVHYETGEMIVTCTVGEGWTPETKQRRLHLGQETNRGITGHVVLTGRLYVSGDVSRDPYFLRFFEDTCSEVAAPILGTSGQTRGVISVESPEPNAFDDDECARLTALAQVAAVSLGLEGFRMRERALVETGMSLTATLDIASLMKKVVDETADALRFEDCSVFLLDEQTQHLVLRASRGPLCDHIGQISYHMGEGLTGWVAQYSEPIRLHNPQDDPRWTGRFSEMPPEEIGAFMAAPIISRDKALGVLRVLRRKSTSPWFDNHFTAVDERMLMTIASQLGAAIENACNFQKLLHSERMAAWGELSAKSAHMIGNRTFALKGDLNEMRYLLDLMPAGEVKKQVAAITDSMARGVQRLEELLREFRDFVVATQLTLASANVNTVISETVAETFPKRSPVTLKMNLSETIPPTRCDARKLRLAFSEMIENSLSFMPDGGELRISTRMLTPEERTGLRLAHARDYLEIEFADTGPGVPPEIKERIWQPFFTSRVKGMGLGLSIVKGVVEAHQGFIQELGTPGEGARFLIHLPIDK